MRLAVAPDLRRRGIGGRLYKRVQAFAGERQADSIRAAYVEHSRFTGVIPAFRQRGIATALKVQAIRSAKARGVEKLETENRADNLGMLAINRKLGYRCGPPEVECVKRLR